MLNSRHLLALLLGTAGAMGAAHAAHAQTLDYCTNVGPVTLAFDHRRVTGRYTIVLPGRSFGGTLTGEMEDHLLEARWSDPDGGGRILIGLSADKGHFTAIYNSNEHPQEWYSWKGALKGSEEAEELRCESPAF